jgi:hypothetical protein
LTPPGRTVAPRGALAPGATSRVLLMVRIRLVFRQKQSA